MLALAGCTNVFYQPSREKYFTPSEKAGAEPEEVFFQSPDGPRLHGWFFSSKKSPSQGTVIQFHGNAENMTSHFLSTAWVIRYGYNLFTFDYRGYGQSEGAPYPAGVHLDALAALNEVKRRAVGPVIVYGQSLGGAIALRALEDWGGRTDVQAIVIESSFLSYRKIARQKLADYWLTWPFQWMSALLVSDSHSPKKKILELAPIPILVVHGTEDPIVPFKFGKAIFDAAGEPKCLWPIASTVHGHLMNTEQGRLRQPMVDFFERRSCPVSQSN